MQAKHVHASQPGGTVSHRHAGRTPLLLAAFALAVVLCGTAHAGSNLTFTENVGQWPDAVKYKADAGSATLWITEDGIYHQFFRLTDSSQIYAEDPVPPESLAYDQLMIKAQLVGSAVSPPVGGEGLQTYYTNYFLGNDPAGWYTNVPNYNSVRYTAVYPGVDLSIYSDSVSVEYDFVVAPTVDPSVIRLEYQNVQSIQVNLNGDLEITTSLGVMIEKKPVAYQSGGAAGMRASSAVTEVACEFETLGGTTFGFRFPNGYDTSQTLVIDPILVYSSFLGGSDSDIGYGVAVDVSGAAYVTGSTYSTNFPLVNPFQLDQLYTDGFVSKVTPDGSALVYSTYLGGSGTDYGDAIAVDGSGSAYITGRTGSNNFPTVSPVQAGLGGNYDAFVTKLNATGTALVYSTYFGGMYPEFGYGIDVDATGRACIAGITNSPNLFVLNAFQAVNPGAQSGFVARLNASGSAFEFSTYLGGSGNDYLYDVEMDASGAAYVTGFTYSTDYPLQNPIQTTNLGRTDVTVTKFSVSGTSLVYSTYLGGWYYDYGESIDLDGLGRCYIAGYTNSVDFPTQNAIQPSIAGYSDAFVLRLNVSGSALEYSTYLGGSNYDYADGVAVSSSGAAYVAGYSTSGNFPLTNQLMGYQGGYDAFLTLINPSGSAHVFSTYWGGSGVDRAWYVAADANGCAYLTGQTASANFPTQGAFQPATAGNYDAFVSKICLSDPPIALCQNVTANADVNCQANVAASAVDNGSYDPDGGTVTLSLSPPGPYSLGATLVTLTVTDDESQQATCQATITVVDNTPPTVTCPANIVVNNDADQCGAIVNYPAAVAADNCPGVVVGCAPVSGSFFPVGTTVVTCTATDAAGNTNTCTFTVTVNDTQNPTVNCPANVAVNTELGMCGATVHYGAAVANDNCPGVVVNCVPASGSFFPKGVTVVTCTATDASGNIAQCNFNVTVTDNEDPNVNCPPNMIVNNTPGQCGTIVNYPAANATDNCPGVVVNCAPASGGFFPVGVTPVTCTATDASGNTKQCTFTITVRDAEAPHVACPAAVVVNNTPGQCGAIVNYAAATATDNCPGVVVNCVPASGTFFQVGTTPVICTATDASGNTDVCNFSVTVVDNEDPVAQCPGAISVNTDLGYCDAVVNWTATATDNCAGVNIVCAPPSGSIFPVGTSNVTCTATDASGNTDVCMFTVTVTDNQNPVAHCPGNISVSTDPGACDATVSWTATATDNCPNPTIVCAPPSGSVFPIGTTTVTCTTTDASGNTGVCSFTVTVADHENPIAQCPASITVNGDPSSCDAVVTWVATATDNCPGVNISCVPPSGSTFPVGVTSVTCTATDAAGNTDVCSFNVTVLDTENPVAQCPGDITVDAATGACDATVTWIATATDNCPGVTISCSPSSGSIFPVGVTTVTCTATDVSGNTDACTFDVTVRDVENPVAQCPLDITVDADPGACEATVTWIATVTDNCPGATISCVPPSGSIFPVGVTTVTCTATDASGNTGVCTFTVTVQDTEAPVAQCPASISANNDPGLCEATVTWLATATDNCPGVTINCVPPSGSVFPVGVTTVTCTATDASGNTDVCTFDVTVLDTEAPVAWCPGDLTFNTDPGVCEAEVMWITSVSDNCPGATISCVPPPGSIFSVGVTSVTCTATDASGNIDVCTFNVTVVDNEPPVAQCPADITVDNDPGSCDAVVTWLATVSDNCPGAVISCDPSSGSTFPVGVTTVTCTATDASGNTDQCTFTVTVLDTEPPVAQCPAGITVNNDPGSCDAMVTWLETVSDNCPGATISCSPSSGSFFPVGVTTVTCTATDAAGNTDQCTFTVTVLDTEPPVAECPASITINNDPGLCDAVVTWIAMVSDNCPGATISCSPPPGSIFPVGVTTVTCTATDASGNTDQCTFTVTVLDIEPPVPQCPADITVDNDPGSCDAMVTWVATVTDNCPGATIDCSPPSGSIFPVGITTVTCIATDASGNTDQCTFTVTVLDTEPPVAECPASITVNNDPGSCGAMVTWLATVSDNCPGATISCSPPSGAVLPVGVTIVACTATDAAGNTDQCTFTVTVRDAEPPVPQCPQYVTASNDPGLCDAVVTWVATVSDNCPGATISCNPPSGSVFPVGITIVTCTATDASGNTDQCSFTVMVADVEPPVPQCPADITVGNDPGLCDAVVTWIADVSDNCPGATIDCSPPSGSTFPVGVTTVTCTATDASGNIAQCSFTVTVNDTENPVAQCPDAITADNDPGACGAVVTFASAFTDNCPGGSIVCLPASGSFFDVGETVVTCIATDAAGNTGECTFTVTVNDIEDPVAQCPADISVGSDFGLCGATVNFTATVLDNCPGATVACDPPSGSFFDVGQTVVTCTATDASGNTHECTFTVTVDDTEAPVGQCPDDMSMHRDFGLCGAYVPFSSTVDDNCPNASITCALPSGSFFPLGVHQVTCTAEDEAGNTDECTFTIEVTNSPPVITCPNPDDAGILCNQQVIDDDGIFNLGDLISGDAVGFDPDGDPLDYAVVSVSHDGSPATPVNAPTIDGLGHFAWQSSGSDAPGIWEFCLAASDGCAADTCCFSVELESKFYLTIRDETGTVDTIPSLPGQIACLYVHLNPDIPLGGFDLLFSYDQSALSFIPPPERYNDLLAWEYYTYRTSANSNCSGNCPSGLVRVVAIADLDNGPTFHPPDEAFGLEDRIIRLCFQVTGDWNFLGQCVPVGFETLDCGDNILASRDGNTSYMPFNSDPECLVGGGPNKPVPVEKITLCGAWICIREPNDARGDINLDGIPNTVADAVLFGRYFIEGESVWDPLWEAVQVQATDVNNDGVALTVADLVYLIRIITGDETPFPDDNGNPKIAPSAGQAEAIVTRKGDHVTVSTDAAVDLGGAYFIFRHSGLDVGEAKACEPATGMVVRSRSSKGELRVLVAPQIEVETAPATIPAGEHELFTIDVSGAGTIELVDVQMADARGAVLATDYTKLAPPKSYALMQNYPNPFNAGTVIPFDLKERSNWIVTIYNITGQSIRSFSGTDGPSRVRVRWDGTDRAGNEVASGIYFYRITAGAFTGVRKMTLVK